MERFEDTWVVMPVFNEDTVIGEVLAELLPTFPHVVCVDDASTDSSASIALDTGAVVIRHPINLGQGAALQTGFDYIRDRTSAQYVITFDADGQHLVSDALQMRQVAEKEDCAIIYGSRFLRKPSPVGWLKRLVLRTAAAAMRFRTGLDLTDAHNGLRLLRRDALCAVELRHNRMAHATEIVDQLAKSGLPWKEIPVTIQYTEYTRKKGQSLLNSVNIVVDLLVR